MCALHFHSIQTALMACCSRCIDISENAVQSPCKRYGRPQHMHNDPCVHPRSSNWVVRDLTAQLWRPYNDPIALLLERWAMAFVLSMLKVPAVVPLSMWSHSICWRSHCIACDHTAHTSAFCIFLGRHGIVVRTLLWCGRGLPFKLRWWYFVAL